jgi:14-3-3 protein epsilon
MSASKTIHVDAFGELTRENLLFLARSAESAERYEDMTKFMNKLVLLTSVDSDLGVEERNLLSVAYKNVVGARRASWRTLNLDEHKNNEQIKIFRGQVEHELSTICKEVLALLDQQLVPAASKSHSVEAQVFYLKMAGDYYRYFAEFQPEDSHAKSALTNYEKAYKLATEGSGTDAPALAPTHPIRLGLALNFSVCHYEILKNPEEACKLAKKAFDDAVSKLEGLTENEYKDSTLIMQLLRDNLTLWTQDNQDASGDE